MKYLLPIIMLTLVIFTQGCTTSGTNQTSEVNEDNQQIDNTGTEENASSANNNHQENGENHSASILGEAFNPPHFSVKRFTAHYQDKVLKLDLSYTINDDIYQRLKGQNYYMQFTLPAEIQSLLKVDGTDILKAPVATENKLDYQMTAEIELDQELTKADGKKVEAELAGYQLTIFNQDKEAIHLFDDIAALSTVGAES